MKDFAKLEWGIRWVLGPNVYKFQNMDSNKGENILLAKLLYLFYVCKHLEFVNDDDVTLQVSVFQYLVQTKQGENYDVTVKV